MKVTYPQWEKSADLAGWKLIIKIKMSLQPQAQMLTSM